MSNGSGTSIEEAISQSLAYHRSKDDEANKLSAPPASERLRWASFWLVDFITPTVLPHTIERLRLSPLERTEPIGPSEPLSQWIADFRTSALSGGFVNLPLCTRPGTAWGHLVTCEDLPDEIEFVQTTVHSLTPGLQVVIACFHLTATARLVLQEVLRTPRQTETVPLPSGGVRFLEPPGQKGAEYRLVRQAIHSSAGQWLGGHLPGVFTRLDEEGASAPSCDFIVTRNRVPFRKPVKKPATLLSRFDDYMRVAGLHEGYDAWRSDTLPGFGLSLPHRRNDPGMLTLAARERDIRGFAEAAYGHELLTRTTYKLHEYIDGLLVTWGLLELARHFNAELSELRDTWRQEAVAASSAAHRVGHAAVALGKVTESRSIARDLLSSTEPEHRSQREPLRFERAWPIRRHSEDELHGNVVATLRYEAEALGTLGSDLEALIVAGSNLDAAAANISLQSRLTKLTKWLVVLTLILVILTAVLMCQTYLASRDAPRTTTNRTGGFR